MNRWTVLAGILFLMGALWLVGGASALFQGTMQSGSSFVLVLVPMIGLAWYGGYLCLKKSRAISAPTRLSTARRVAPSTLPPPPPPPPPPASSVAEAIQRSKTGVGEAQAIPEAGMSEWEKRYRFFSSQKSGSGCDFKDSSGNCVSPSPDYPIVRCSASPAASAAASATSGRRQPCFVYPILTQKLAVWEPEFRNRMSMEAQMAGPIGECRICGKARKLNQDGMCSICVLAEERADKVFDRIGKESVYCDGCSSKITRGEAFMPAEPTEMCCIDCWKRTYSKY